MESAGNVEDVSIVKRAVPRGCFLEEDLGAPCQLCSGRPIPFPEQRLTGSHPKKRANGKSVPELHFLPKQSSQRLTSQHHCLRQHSHPLHLLILFDPIATMARTRSQGISPNAPLRLLTPPRGTRRRRAPRNAPAETASVETAPIRSEINTHIEPTSSTDDDEASDSAGNTVEATEAVAKSSPHIEQIEKPMSPAISKPKSPAIISPSPRRPTSNISYERLRPEKPVSPLHSAIKHLRDDEDENDENKAEPSAKRQRLEPAPSVPATPQTKAPRGNLLSSVSRGVGSVLSRLFKSPQPEPQKPTVLSSPTVDDDQGDVSSTLDLITASPSVRASHQRSPLSLVPNNATPASTRPLTPYEIIAREPNYIPKTDDQIRENLRKLRYPDQPWLKDVEENESDEKHRQSHPTSSEGATPPRPKFTPRRTPVTSSRRVDQQTPTQNNIFHQQKASVTTDSTPTSKKRKRAIPMGNYFDRAYADASDEETEASSERSMSPDKIVPPRSALKQKSVAPDTVERSNKRVKFGSPLEEGPTPTMRRTGIQSQNSFVDDDHSSFTDDSILRTTIANTTANTPRNPSFVTPGSRRHVAPASMSFSEPSGPRFVPPRGFRRIGPSPRTPLSQRFQRSTPLTSEVPPPSSSGFFRDDTPNNDSTFIPRAHHPTPSTYCLPDEWSDESGTSSESNTEIAAVAPSSPPAVTTSATPPPPSPPTIVAPTPPAPETVQKAVDDAQKHKPSAPSNLHAHAEVSPSPASSPVEDEWHFPAPQTYVEAGTMTQEVMDIVNENWTEEDSEDAVMFFRRGFEKYCREIDEYESKGLKVEIEC